MMMLHTTSIGSMPAQILRRSALGFQGGFGEGIELRYRGARDAEDQPAAASESYPGFERGDTFGAEALEERQWQFRRQRVRHVGESSEIAAFAKRELTSSGHGAADW